MDGVGGVPGAAIRWLGPKAPGLVVGTGRFRPNGTSNPTVFAGSLNGLFTVTYAATGLYTVAFTPTGFKFPTGKLPIIIPSVVVKDLTSTNMFEVCQKGEWSNTTKSFVLAAFQSFSSGAGTAFAPPTDADCWVNFLMIGQTK